MDSILKISESALNPREEAVSILTFIASFPPVLSDDLEATAKELSKILFHCLDTYDEEQFCDRLLCIVEHIKDRPYINVSSHQKIFIRDSYLFRITLFVSLKHVKFLFLRCPLNSQYINNFLSKILLNILDDIHIDRAPSIHLVRLILLIVKKRGDVVDPNLAFTILKCMNKVAVSPLTSFKRCAHDISRIVIHLLSSSQRSLLNNLSSIPLTGVDFSDNLKLILRKESVQRFAPRMCDHILKLFCNNVSSRDGGAYYNIQIQFYEFEEFKRCLWPLYKEHLQHFEEEGSEKMKLYSNLVVAYKRLTSEDCECAALKKIFGRHVNNLDVTCLFHCVLLLDIFMELRKYHSTDLTSIIESSLRFFGRIFDDELHNHMDIKTTKVLEAYINSVIECLVVSKHHWDVFPKDHVLNQLCKIIKKSNMKRPLSLAINAVQHFGTHMEHEDKDREIKIRLLDKTLRSLVNTQKKQTTMIRRNPETRLVIHALCLSDDDSEKPYVDWSLRFLLKTACDAEAPDLTISSTLHCLEVLVSDNSIHQVTLPYVPRIVDCCIEIFNKKSWTVRNANLQLLKSLIGRLYGVPLDHYRRYKTVEDLFTLFPELTVTLFKVLFVPNLKDDAIVALLFFSESQLKKNLLIEESLEEVFKVFRGVFVQIVKSYSNKFGVLAVKSLTALCVDAKIAVVFRDVVQYIENNFAKMKKTFFKNFVLLLRDLYNKHRTSLDKCNGHIIDMSMGKLRTFLRQYDYFCFNLLSLKLFPLNDVIHEVFVKLNILQNYKARIWLDNYVPFVLSTIKIQHMPGFLQNVLFAKNSPAFLQVKILSILADRLSILYRDRNVEIRIVMTILLHRITELKDSDNFLVTSYAKSIFLLNEMINDLFISPSLLDNIRRDCETKNIYKMIIYVLVFSYLNKDDRTIEDSRFLSRCLDSCMEVSEDDDDILFDISSTLMQFYKCCPPQSRYSIFKLAFRLLLRIPTCFEICKFVSSLTTSRCSAALICLNTFLSPDNLRACFDDQNLIIKLLLDLYCDVRDLPEEYEESGTFYLFQNDYSLPKLHIRRVIKRSLSTVLLCIQF